MGKIEKEKSCETQHRHRLNLNDLFGEKAEDEQEPRD